MSSQRCARAYIDHTIRIKSDNISNNDHLHPVCCRQCPICSTSRYPVKEGRVVGSCSLQCVAKCHRNWKWFAPKAALHSIRPFSNGSRYPPFHLPKEASIKQYTPCNPHDAIKHEIVNGRYHCQASIIHTRYSLGSFNTDKRSLINPQ